MIDSDREIRCMLVPLRKGRLIVPNAAVAEVIGYREPDPLQSVGPWLQGVVSWHQRELPVLDFEYLDDEPNVAAGIRQRIAVCYAVDQQARWPLFGLVAQGIPRLMRLREENMDTASGHTAGSRAERARFWVGEDEFILPDFDYLGARLAAV